MYPATNKQTKSELKNKAPKLIGDENTNSSI